LHNSKNLDNHFNYIDKPGEEMAKQNDKYL